MAPLFSFRRDDMTLEEFIELFLAGYDDKVYINLQEDDYCVMFENIRIIDPRLKTFYNWHVYALREDPNLSVFIHQEV